MQKHKKQELLSFLMEEKRLTRYFAIAGVQTAITPGNTNENATKMVNSIENISAAFPWVDMICFSELCVTGFNPATWRMQAEPIPGNITDKFCEMAKANKKWLLPGSMIEVDEDKIYNCAVIISPEGKITAKYRKMFPWSPFETTTPGNKFCVFDIANVGRFGLCICYDSWFPEVARTLAWMGAEVVLHPTMTPSSASPLEVTVNKANAIFNQCYIVSIGGVGPQGPITLAGHSMIVDPEGRVVQEAGEGESVMIEILDLDNVTKAREYGTLCIGPFWKHLLEYHHEFSVYEKLEEGEVYKKLGRLKLYDKIRPF